MLTGEKTQPGAAAVHGYCCLAVAPTHTVRRNETGPTTQQHAPTALWSNKRDHVTETRRFAEALENTMGWLSFILQALAPIAVEHGGKALRDSMKSRNAQAKIQAPILPDPVELLSAEVDQLKAQAAQFRSDLDVLNQAVADREEKLRKWLLALL